MEIGVLEVKTKLGNGIEERAEKAFAEIDEKKADTLAKDHSIRERLMRRLKTKTFKLTLQDDEGDFDIYTRLMTSSERFQAVQFMTVLDKQRGNIEEYLKAMAGLKDLAKEVVVTSGLDEYFDSEFVSDDVVMAVILTSLYGSTQAVGESLQLFRT